METLRPPRAAAALAVVVAMAGLAGCQTMAIPEDISGSTQVAQVAPAARSADDAVDRVLAISIDGLNPLAITSLGPEGAPAFHRLMQEGAYTLNARTDYEITKTLPNHTSMLTSRRIDAAKGGHGIDFNSDTGTTVHEEAGHYVASVFDVVHDWGGRTALFSAKTKFELYERTWNSGGAADLVGDDDGTDKIDRFTVDTNNARLVDKVNAELLDSPRTFTFLHISLPDVVGHEDGFMSEDYLDAVEETDRLLGTVLTTIAGKPSLKAHTLVLLTSDHGGNGESHSDPKELENYRVPFMAWGPGVAKGRNLYSLNSSFRAPKGGRPSYLVKQPIRNGDIANLATDALDLPEVPGSEFDRTSTLNVFG